MNLQSEKRNSKQADRTVLQQKLTWDVSSVPVWFITEGIHQLNNNDDDDNSSSSNNSSQ